MISLEAFLDNLAPIVPVSNPLEATDQTRLLRELAFELRSLNDPTRASVSSWVQGRGAAVWTLGLSVGLGQERLKNICQHLFGTGTFNLVAKKHSTALVDYLDESYSLLANLESSAKRQYTFEDILVARAGTRSSALRATQAGRTLEDRLEEVAKTLGLRYRSRGKFQGSNGRWAPYDLAIIDNDDNVVVAVAAKGFDSTGSKLTDAHREIKEMSEVRLPRQFVFAAIDGIGWKSRKNDLRNIIALWESGAIAGVYTAATMSQFEADLRDAAKRLNLQTSTPMRADIEYN